MSLKLTLDFSPMGEKLEDVVPLLSIKTKQAFYIVAQKGTLARGTWNGCIFNAAGSEQGKDVTSVPSAMRVFGASKYIVERFIRAWDASKFRPGWVTDVAATANLIDLLEKVGLRTPPAQASIETYEDAEGLEEFLMEAELQEMVAAIELMAKGG